MTFSKKVGQNVFLIFIFGSSLKKKIFSTRRSLNSKFLKILNCDPSSSADVQKNVQKIVPLNSAPYKKFACEIFLFTELIYFIVDVIEFYCSFWILTDFFITKVVIANNNGFFIDTGAQQYEQV